jgi:hypothetical protein
VGELPENAGTLTDKLVERKSLKMDIVPEHSHAKHDIKGAKLAVTHYRVLERLPGHTVVEVKLETGRRNQIRVQFSERGFPLLGDQVYGSTSNVINRQALHAELLGFRHPVTEESVTVTAPIPADMENVLRVLRNVRRVVRADAGITGEEGLYKPKITKERKNERYQRSEKFGENAKPGQDSKPRPGAKPRVEGAVSARPRTRPEGDAAPRTRTRPEGDAAPRTRTRPEGDAAPRTRTRPEGSAAPRPSTRPEGASAPRKSARSEAAAGPRPYIFPEAAPAPKPRATAARSNAPRPSVKPAGAVRKPAPGTGPARKTFGKKPR